MAIEELAQVFYIIGKIQIMRTLVNLIILFALPFVLSEDKSPAEIPPSQRLTELRPDTSFQVKKAALSQVAQDDLKRDFILDNISFTSIKMKQE